MSRLILTTDQLKEFTAESTNILRRCRVIAQFRGLGESADNPTATTLQFSDVKQLSESGNDREFNVVKMEIGDKLYNSKFLKIGGICPIEGDILDLRCCVVQGSIEIMDLRVLTLRELSAFTEFLGTHEGEALLHMSA